MTVVQQRKSLTKDNLKAAFSAFDSHPNGILSLAEIDLALRYIAPTFAADKPAIMRAYKAADANADGFISKQEFPKFVDLLFTYDEFYQTFKKNDTDGDHRIDFAEFKKGCKLVGIEEKHALVEFKKIDKNGGGKILFDEFVAFMSVKDVQKESRWKFWL